MRQASRSSLSRVWSGAAQPWALDGREEKYASQVEGESETWTVEQTPALLTVLNGRGVCLVHRTSHARRPAPPEHKPALSLDRGPRVLSVDHQTYQRPLPLSLLCAEAIALAELCPTQIPTAYELYFELLLVFFSRAYQARLVATTSYEGFYSSRSV